jgi:hypothetical protein
MSWAGCPEGRCDCDNPRCENHQARGSAKNGHRALKKRQRRDKGGDGGRDVADFAAFIRIGVSNLLSAADDGDLGAQTRALTMLLSTGGKMMLIQEEVCQTMCMYGGSKLVKLLSGYAAALARPLRDETHGSNTSGHARTVMAFSLLADMSYCVGTVSRLLHDCCLLDVMTKAIKTIACSSSAKDENIAEGPQSSLQASICGQALMVCGNMLGDLLESVPTNATHRQRCLRDLAAVTSCMVDTTLLQKVAAAAAEEEAEEEKEGVGSSLLLDYIITTKQAHAAAVRLRIGPDAQLSRLVETVWALLTTCPHLHGSRGAEEGGRRAHANAVTARARREAVLLLLAELEAPMPIAQRRSPPRWLAMAVPELAPSDAFAVVEARALMCYWEAALLPEPSMDAALRDRDAPQSFAVRAEPSSTQAIGRTRVMAMIEMGSQGGSKSSWCDHQCQVFCSNRLMGVSLAAGIPVAAMVQAGVPRAQRM